MARRVGHRSSLIEARLVPNFSDRPEIRLPVRQDSPPLLRKSGKLTKTSLSLPAVQTEAIAWAGNADPQYHDLKARFENFVARNESDLHMAPDTDSKLEGAIID